MRMRMRTRWYRVVPSACSRGNPEIETPSAAAAAGGRGVCEEGLSDVDVDVDVDGGVKEPDGEASATGCGGAHAYDCVGC